MATAAIETAKHTLNTFHNYTTLAKQQTCDLKSPNKLPDEPVLMALNRSFSFLYQKFQGIAVPSRKKRYTTKEERAELRDAVTKALKESGGELDVLSQTLFKTPLRILDNEFAAWENWSPSHIIDRGSPYAVCSFAVSTYLVRLIPLLLYTDRQQQYFADYSDYFCKQIPNENPIRNLNESVCVAISTDRNILEKTQSDLGIKFGGYILLNPKFFIPDKPTVFYITANRILATSFIVDALLNNGIEETNIEAFQKMLTNRSPPSSGGRRRTRRKKRSGRSRSTLK